MRSRRDFLKTAAVAGSAVMLPAGVAAADQACSSLPPPITSLKSMKDQAKPITAEERRARINKALQLMQQNKVDALMLCSGTSLVYFSGIDWWPSERFFAMVLPAKGEPFYVSPAFEEGRAREQISEGPLGNSADVRVWQEDDDPYARVAQGLKDRGIAGGTLAVEEEVPFVLVDGVSKAAPTLKITSGSAVTAGCRMIKSQHELDLMQLANHVTLKAYEAAYRALQDGMTQTEFGRLVREAHKQLGFDGVAGVQVGTYSALPHGSRTPQVVRPGTILLIDGGCRVEGYCSDISRTFVLGKPTDKMKSVFDIVHRAQSAALAAAKPGVPLGDVDGAARKVIVDAGYGPEYKYFTHRVGHGIGMDGHEWPYLIRGHEEDKVDFVIPRNHTFKLQPSMTFSDEPGIYIPGEFGVRLEDDMVITDKGAELFTPQSPSLEDPFQRP